MSLNPWRAVSSALLVLSAFSLGCDPIISEKEMPIASPTTQSSATESTASEPATTESLTTETQPPTKSEPPKKPATDAEAKPADTPLDESIHVDDLLAARLDAEILNQGWIRLFDGQSLMGWKDAGKANWRVEDGAITADSGEMGLLCTSVRYSDFELELEFNATSTTNSGIFLRTPAKPTDPTKDCYELNIAPPDNPFPTGSLVGRAKVSEQAEEPEPGEWHTLHALVDRDHVQIWLNGVETANYTDTTGLTSGLIGLQFRESAIRFRNIRLRPITYSVLPKTTDNKDWNEPKGDVKVEFTATGALEMTGGKGHIELLQPHANVCIQFQVTTLAEKVNSGLFFRCIPGEDMNGYECQVHHGYNEDRRRPVDSGIGAIFRRQAARAVLSDEGKPAFVTVIADGPQIATWVNGIQVTDWADTRAPNANPRKGLRTEAGTIMLQGHDPGCKVRFDSLSICPLP